MLQGMEHVIPFVKQVEWSRLRQVRVYSWIGLVFFLVFFLPFIADGLAISLALGLLVPLALIVGAIEHFAPPLWLLVLLFIHICGLADLTTDCILLGKVLKAYFTGVWDDDEVEEEPDVDELNFLLARTIMTLVGALPVMFYIMFGDNILKGFKRDMGLSSESSSSSSSSSSAYTNSGVAIVLLALVWKGAMVLMRVYLLYRVSRDIITQGHVRKESKAVIEVLELLLLADLLFSGIPLGVLTFVELFFFNEGFQVLHE